VRSVSAIYCFNHEHSCLVRSRRGPCLTTAEVFRFRDRHPPGGGCSSTQRFHAARVTVVDERVRFSEPFIEPLSCLSRLLDVPACGSLRSGPHIEAAPRARCDAVREDYAVLRSGTTSVERYISSASVLRRLPHVTGSGPDVVSLSGFRWFCRQRAVPLRRFAVAISRCVCKRDCLG